MLAVALRSGLVAFLVGLLPPAGLQAQDRPEDEYAAMLVEAQRKLRKGELTAAENLLQELLDAEAEPAPEDRPSAQQIGEARIALLSIVARQGRYEQVRDQLQVLPDSLRQRRDASLLAAQVLAALGEYEAGAAALQGLATRTPRDFEAQHLLGELDWQAGRRQAARARWQENAAAPRPEDATGLTFQARSLWRLGGRARIEAASQLLVAALALPDAGPEARATLGQLKFEAYGEAGGLPSGEKDFAKVLEQFGEHEPTLLAMYRLRAANMSLDGNKTEAFLERALQQNPRCVEALVLRAANILDDRRFRPAAERLDAALAIRPRDLDALCHRAAAAWLLHDQAEYQRFRQRALVGDPGWPQPDRVLGDHLVALYRFADALPFYEAALAVAPDDLPSLQGKARALVYCGRGAEARELLLRAKQLAAGLVDPWRNNAIAVQELLDAQYTTIEHPQFRLVLHRDDVEVLSTYLLPLQVEAYEVLGAKYNHRPDQPVRVEVLHTWDDFSVRTIGFRGFTALGACFGKFLTLVSPRDQDLRRQDFMWEATAWHEYAHVLTLGLSRHRVPRWLTEGFSVYEERERDRSWERGMDRELLDAFHNRDIPPIQLLNRLFRGPRILFGYYQGGLLVELIAKRYGFAKALDLLQAYGQDLDTEEAFQQALGMPSSRLDAMLLEFVERERLRGMKLVPRYSSSRVQELAQAAAQQPQDLDSRVALAWSCLQLDNPIDAGRWLAEVLRQQPGHGPALLARAELLMRRKEVDAALATWQTAFATGAEDFDSRLRYADALLGTGDVAAAIAQYELAKACWPTCTEQAEAPELKLAAIYRQQGEQAKAQQEMKAYCRRSARAFAPRYTLAELEREAGNREEELRFLIECNRIDPFHRELHRRMGEAWLALGKRVEAAREFAVAAAVPPSLDRRTLQRDFEPRSAEDPAERQERGELWLRAAKLRHELGDREAALALLQRIRSESGGTGSAAEAERLQQDWQGR